MNPNHDASVSKGAETLTTIPGLHVVANFAVRDAESLTRSEPFRSFIHSEIEKLGLVSVGEVFHQFENGGFTGVVCLTESHLSIHTWPEHNYLTFDVFLSSYLKDNRQKTRELYADVVAYFGASILFEQIIER